MLILALALADPAHASELERLSIGVASGLRAGDPYIFHEPLELTVTSWIIPWLAVQGRAGLSLHHGYYFLPDGFTGILAADLRFGKDRGPYGSVGAQVFFPPEHALSEPEVTGGLRGGWRFVVGDIFRIAPELQLGVFYGGVGVHFDFATIKG